jgi:hypothetical protein
VLASTNAGKYRLTFTSSTKTLLATSSHQSGKPGLGPSQVEFIPARKGLFFGSGKLLIRQDVEMDDLPSQKEYLLRAQP